MENFRLADSVNSTPDATSCITESDEMSPTTCSLRTILDDATLHGSTESKTSCDNEVTLPCRTPSSFPRAARRSASFAGRSRRCRRRSSARSWCARPWLGRAVEPADIDEVILGNVLSAGVGQAPARQAALRAGLPPTVAALTVNKVCGSGLKAVMLAAQGVRCGDVDLVVAGGMESMSQAGWVLPRDAPALGDRALIDSHDARRADVPVQQAIDGRRSRTSWPTRPAFRATSRIGSRWKAIAGRSRPPKRRIRRGDRSGSRAARVRRTARLARRRSAQRHESRAACETEAGVSRRTAR